MTIYCNRSRLKNVQRSRRAVGPMGRRQGSFLSLILLIGWEVLNKAITASVGESGMIIQIIKGYGSYPRFKFLVNLEPLNREPVNR